MPTGRKGQRRPADVIDNAIRVAQIATGEVEKEFVAKPEKNEAAGRTRQEGAARAKAMTPEKRAEIARKAAAKRRGLAGLFTRAIHLSWSSCRAMPTRTAPDRAVRFGPDRHYADRPRQYRRAVQLKERESNLVTILVPRAFASRLGDELSRTLDAGTKPQPGH
jgi:hypothetical protein